VRRRTHERHTLGEVGWLRAGVLGANDGIVSTSSLILGVAAAHSAHNNILLSGVAGLVAGAMSMAIGEYVSVHSQADSEAAAIAQEKDELRDDYVGERRELTDIYVRRGLDLDLAKKVSQQLMDHDALAAHARDELGLTPHSTARPLQAALSSAASFTVGSAVPLAVVAFAAPRVLIRRHRRGIAAVPTGSGRRRRQSSRRQSRGRRAARGIVERARHGRNSRRGRAARY
jgi:VIT1/CCC1 family predicted Fe2+/Mn2+ transporter